MTQENCIHILKEYLIQFDVSLEVDIMAIVIDGTNVILKVGKDVDTKHQLCFAHDTHLVVCDVRYNEKKPQKDQSTSDFDEDLNCQNSDLIIFS